jgi:hypothetical protein
MRNLGLDVFDLYARVAAIADGPDVRCGMLNHITLQRDGCYPAS